MSEFIRVVKTTISEYVKGEEKNILANQKLTAMLQAKKRITYNHSGKDLTWVVRKSRNSLSTYADGGTLTFNRVNRHLQATVPIVSYAVGEAITKKEKLMNRGREALVNYASSLGEMMVDDIKFGFNGELYKDGLGGNADTLHGFQTFTGVTSNAQYTAPSDTYAGLSTVLGNYGGTALSGSWPTGTFDPEYYFWSPLVVNYTHASWAAGTDNWANNCIECLRKGIIFSKNLKGKDGMVDLVMMTPSMYADTLDAFDEKERIQVMRDGEKSGLVSLGFRDVVNFDGVDLTSEYDCPDTQAHGININSLELCSWQGQLFDTDDSEDIDTLADKLAVTFFGNMKANPRNHIFFDNIT